MQGKKTFLLYCDMIHIFEELTDEQAGILIKHIMSYVNDKNPVLENQTLRIAFAPIKNVLKKDLEEWLKICERNAQNGKKGGRPRNQDNPKEPNGFSGNLNNPVKADKDMDKDMDNNNRAFIADADKNLKHYRNYFYELIKEKQIRRDELFSKCKIDLSKRNELWEDFISNSIINVPLIEDEKHAWNTFKKFVTDNQKKYQKQINPFINNPPESY